MSIKKLAKQLYEGDISSENYKIEIKKLIKDENNIKPIIDSLYSLEFGFPSIQVMSVTTGIPYDKVKAVMSSNPIWTQFAKPTKVQNYRFITSNFVDETWTADLSEWGANKRMYNKQFVQNDGYVYILHIIDLFSRYLWLFPLKDKEGKSIADCFNSLAKDGLHPKKLFVDKGSEFYNKYMDYYCDKYKVERYSVTTNRNASIAERNIRSIREILFKYFEKTGKERWIDILDKVEDVYNNRVHSLLGMSPEDARESTNFEKVYKIMSKGSKDWFYKIDQDIKFDIGDRVRTKVMKGKFDKGSKPKFSKDIYTVSEIGYDGIHYYVLKEFPDKFYYGEELIRVNV